MAGAQRAPESKFGFLGQTGVRAGLAVTPARDLLGSGFDATQERLDTHHDSLLLQYLTRDTAGLDRPLQVTERIHIIVPLQELCLQPDPVGGFE